MTDFLKATPAFSMNDVLWKLSVPFVRIMMTDATQVIYLTEEQKKKYKQARRTGNRVEEVTDDPDAFAKSLGIPTF